MMHIFGTTNIKRILMHMFETPNDAHVWDDKHQMAHMFETTNAKWRTCLRRQTPNDTHVWDDKRQMTHMFETTGFDTTNITVKKFNSTITTKTTLYQCDTQQLSQ